MKVNDTKIHATWVSAAGWSYHCGIERSLKLYYGKTMGVLILYLRDLCHLFRGYFMDYQMHLARQPFKGIALFSLP